MKMSQTNGKAIFFAFVSHKSDDSALALRLQKFIESYRLPTEIRKKAQAPKYLSPVCSYEVDFASNPLSDEMDDKLNRSHFLILLCSQALIQKDPKYINYEIERFIECKQKEGIDPLKRIIPVIVDGEFDSPTMECCPDALKALGDKRPIAIDVRKYKNERDAFLHIMSGMLDMDYAVLARRDAKYRRNRRIAISTILSVLLIISGFLCEYFIPRKSYYLDFVMKEGLPVGIEKLSESKYNKINHYVITRHKHKIVSLEFVNSKGNLIDHSGQIIVSDRPAKYEFDYNSSGLTKTAFLNKSGKAYFVQQYSDDKLLAVDFKDPSDMSKAYFIGAGYESDPSVLLSDYNIIAHSNVSRFQYEYTDGYVSKVTFHRDNSGAMAEDYSVYGFEYSRDKLGRIVKIYYLDALGEKRVNSAGVFCKEFSYDENNNLVCMKNLDSDGKVIQDEDGIYQIAREFNKYHQVEVVKFLDANDKLIVVEKYNYALKKTDIDTNVHTLYDENAKLISNGAYCAVEILYDENGYDKSLTYLDKDEKPVNDSSKGYARLYQENDEKGNVISVSFLDAKGNLVNNVNGYAKEERSYNDKGLVIENIYYDKDGNKADYKQYGYSVVRSTYDEFGRELTVSYYDADDNPVEIKGPSYAHGYHKLETEYHSSSNLKMTSRYYGKDGKLINSKTNAQGETYAEAVYYMQNGFITSATYYDKDGKVWGNIIENTVDYSPTAEKIETALIYNADKKLISKNVVTYSIEGVVSKTEMTEYDELGKVTDETNYIYDEAGKKVSAERVSYASDGTVESEFYEEYDENEKTVKSVLISPKETKMYKAEAEFTYHNNLEVKEEKNVYSNSDGKIENQTIRTFNQTGEKAGEKIIFYTDGVPSVKTETKYHKNGKIAENKRISLTEDGKDGDITSTTYDENGNKLVFHSEEYLTDEKMVGDIIYNPDGSYKMDIKVYNLDGTLKDSNITEFDKDGNRK